MAISLLLGIFRTPENIVIETELNKYYPTLYNRFRQVIRRVQVDDMALPY